MLDPVFFCTASLCTALGVVVALPLAYYFLCYMLATPIPSIRVEVCAARRVVLCRACTARVPSTRRSGGRGRDALADATS